MNPQNPAKERYTIIVTLKDGTTREFKNVKNYGWVDSQTSSFLYLAEVGTLTETSKTQGKYETNQHWINTSEIAELKAFGGKIADTERQLTDLKRELKNG